MTILRHAGVVVSDLEKSLTFYCDLLGLKIAPVCDEDGPFVEGLLGMKDVKIRTAKIGGDDGSSFLELLSFENPAVVKRECNLNNVGPTHIALTVQKLDELYQTLLKYDTPFNAAPVVSVDGKAKVAFCRDPDGTYIELVEMLD